VNRSRIKPRSPEPNVPEYPRKGVAFILDHHWFRLSLIALAVATLLSVAPLPASAQPMTTPDRVFFPQTGHYLSFGFLDYWRHHGDINVFGYPISEEMSDPASGLTVQYFERAVFEYHPDNSPGWQVELRRLGADLVAERGDEDPFRPIAGADSSCRFYAETGHQICDHFLNEWDSNGALPLFGYPLSEPFTEGGYTVQYFERARFEWHPENQGTPYEVLFGLLGRDAALKVGANLQSLPASPDIPSYAPELFNNGSLTVALPVTFHAQQDPDWCDPADIQMWLEAAGVPLQGDADTAIQSDVWNYETANNDGFTLEQWHASPYAVAAALNAFGAPVAAGDVAFDDIQLAGAAIARSVAADHLPVIALVDKGTHYVLVTGVVLGPGGVDSPPTSVMVDDPWTYPTDRDGFPAMGQGTWWDWTVFATRFTRDSTDDPGIWSGNWTLIAAGLPLGR
jgi:hypothetical protein